jgi:predicted enzyme involved in methoxymalonyl-ACP biosynthesis
MGVTRLVGAYLPTAKNDVVADLYPRLGFVAAGDALFARALDAGRDGLETYITPV